MPRRGILSCIWGLSAGNEWVRIVETKEIIKQFKARIDQLYGERGIQPR